MSEIARQADPATRIGRRMLSQRQVADFARDGYLVVRSVLDTPMIATIDRWTRELLEAPERSGRHWVYREASLRDSSTMIVQRIENFCPFHADYHRFVCEGKLIGLVAELFDEPAVLFKEKINFKMPGGAGFKAHQDQQAGWTRYASLFITALVSIDAATRENGCLELAARREPGRLIGEEWRPLENAEVERLQLKAVPTEPGDVILFDSFVPHASQENLSNAPRRVLYLTYNRRTEGDHRARYYRDKHESYPPDIDRVPGREYVFKV